MTFNFDIFILFLPLVLLVYEIDWTWRFYEAVYSGEKVITSDVGVRLRTRLALVFVLVYTLGCPFFWGYYTKRLATEYICIQLGANTEMYSFDIYFWSSICFYIALVYTIRLFCVNTNIRSLFLHNVLVLYPLLAGVSLLLYRPGMHFIGYFIEYFNTLDLENMFTLFAAPVLIVVWCVYLFYKLYFKQWDSDTFQLRTFDTVMSCSITDLGKYPTEDLDFINLRKSVAETPVQWGVRMQEQSLHALALMSALALIFVLGVCSCLFDSSFTAAFIDFSDERDDMVPQTQILSQMLVLMLFFLCLLSLYFCSIFFVIKKIYAVYFPLAAELLFLISLTYCDLPAWGVIPLVVISLYITNYLVKSQLVYVTDKSIRSARFHEVWFDGFAFEILFFSFLILGVFYSYVMGVFVTYTFIIENAGFYKYYLHCIALFIVFVVRFFWWLDSFIRKSGRDSYDEYQFVVKVLVFFILYVVSMFIVVSFIYGIPALDLKTYNIVFALKFEKLQLILLLVVFWAWYFFILKLKGSYNFRFFAYFFLIFLSLFCAIVSIAVAPDLYVYTCLFCLILLWRMCYTYSGPKDSIGYKKISILHDIVVTLILIMIIILLYVSFS